MGKKAKTVRQAHADVVPAVQKNAFHRSKRHFIFSLEATRSASHEETASLTQATHASRKDLTQVNAKVKKQIYWSAIGSFAVVIGIAAFGIFLGSAPSTVLGGFVVAVGGCINIWRRILDNHSINPSESSEDPMRASVGIGGALLFGAAVATMFKHKWFSGFSGFFG